MFGARTFAIAAAGVTMLFAALSANSATVSRQFDGNDCSGYFGTGFDSCTIFVNSGGETIELSPVIAKYEEDLSLDEVNNTVFPTIDGTEFTFSNLGTDNSTGDFLYTKDDLFDPGTRYWATKASDGFILFWEVDDSAVAGGGVCDVADVFNLACLDAALEVTSGSWTTIDDKELSHITFYDTAIIPVPAAVWLFGSALGLLGWVRRRGI